MGTPEPAEPDWALTEALFEGLGVVSDTPPPKWPETTPLIVDSREPEAMVNLLREHRSPVEVRQLEDEDYLIGDVHITRKTFPDLLGSLESGHLSDEMGRLLLHCKKVKMIVEKGPLNRRGGFLYGRLLEAVDALDEKIPIKFTQDMVGTADYLLKLRRRVLEGRFGTVRRYPVIYGHPSALVTYYASLPGVGTTIAEQLAERYKIPADLIQAIRRTYDYNEKKYKTKKRWMELRWDAGIRGMGGMRAEQLAAFLLDGVEPP